MARSVISPHGVKRTLNSFEIRSSARTRMERRIEDTSRMWAGVRVHSCRAHKQLWTDVFDVGWAWSELLLTSQNVGAEHGHVCQESATL